MRRLLALLAVCLLALLSCVPLSQAPGVAPPRFVGQLVGEDYVPAPDMGLLRLVVRWPDRRTAIIPSDTQTLAVKVLDGTEVAAYQEVSRPSGVATQSVRILLKPVSNATVEVRTYREAKPVPEGAEATAFGVAAGVNVVRSKISALDIELGSGSAPAISKLSANVGKVGAEITLTGRNFGDSGQQVTFNGTEAATLTPVDASTLRVVVPTGATVGPLRVTVGNQTSTSQVNFWVVSGLTIGASKPSWDSSGATSLLVLAGKQAAFTASPGWVLTSGKAIEDYGAAPAVTWSSSEAAVGSLDSGSGVFTAADSSGTTTVSARVGPVSSNAVTVTGVRVTGVSLDKESATINLPAPNGYTSAGMPSTVQLGATVAFTSQVTISGVTWSSSDEAVATVNTAGLATAVGTGSVTITATAIDDTRVKATAALTVQALGMIRLRAQ